MKALILMLIVAVIGAAAFYYFKPPDNLGSPSPIGGSGSSSGNDVFSAQTTCTGWFIGDETCGSDSKVARLENVADAMLPSGCESTTVAGHSNNPIVTCPDTSKIAFRGGSALGTIKSAVVRRQTAAAPSSDACAIYAFKKNYETASDDQCMQPYLLPGSSAEMTTRVSPTAYGGLIFGPKSAVDSYLTSLGINSQAQRQCPLASTETATEACGVDCTVSNSSTCSYSAPPAITDLKVSRE